jgi:hypothetical protein
VPGDCWCVTAVNWLRAHREGCAAPVVLASHERTFDVVSLEVLGEHAVDVPDDLALPTATSHVSKSSAEPGKWSASRIAFELSQQGVIISRRTVSRHLAALGLDRRRIIDPTGQTNRGPQRIIARARPYDPRRRQEGRTHPRRRRLARPR